MVQETPQVGPCVDEGVKSRPQVVAPSVFVHKSGKLPPFKRAAAPSGIPAEAPCGFDYPAVLRGNTQHFSVYYNSSLGTNGQAIADGVLATCEAEYNFLVRCFSLTVPSFNIIIAPLDPSGQGGGGAYHYGCSQGTDLYCDAKTLPSLDIDYTRMLVVAEEVEVFEGVQNKGWGCGYSNGEGLSRVLAVLLYSAELDGYASSPTWLDSNRPDFVNKTDPTDRSYVSTGCAVLFLNWLKYQLNYNWIDITQAAAPTLAETYTKLANASNGFSSFMTLLQTHFPQGTPSGLIGDNPFPLTPITLSLKSAAPKIDPTASQISARQLASKVLLSSQISVKSLIGRA